MACAAMLHQSELALSRYGVQPGGSKLHEALDVHIESTILRIAHVTIHPHQATHAP